MNPLGNSYYGLIKAKEFLDTLVIEDPTNALVWCMHQLIWHNNIDRVRWLLDNKELAIKISKYKDGVFLGDTVLKEQFWDSVEKIENYRH